ncbi:UNKNOWN [Stylonychia lemnae]|uniref:Uncharacterized protein n=1 Tax=Stylonychia lemnae TaxID=5949 RepID=A0A078AT93_STYLE|nr:UNKNOWN [Stylonychia lemnae]|eukprot:CDW85414.1 UNKNOWN [Stylonychia lemnae]
MVVPRVSTINLTIANQQRQKDSVVRSSRNTSDKSSGIQKLCQNILESSKQSMIDNRLLSSPTVDECQMAPNEHQKVRSFIYTNDMEQQKPEQDILQKGPQKKLISKHQQNALKITNVPLNDQESLQETGDIYRTSDFRTINSSQSIQNFKNQFTPDMSDIKKCNTVMSNIDVDDTIVKTPVQDKENITRSPAGYCNGKSKGGNSKFNSPMPKKVNEEDVNRNLWCSNNKDAFEDNMDKVTQLRSGGGIYKNKHTQNLECQVFKILDQNRIPDSLEEIEEIIEQDNMSNIKTDLSQYRNSEQDICKICFIDKQLEKSETDLVFFNFSISNQNVDFLRFCQMQLRLSKLVSPWEKNLYISVQHYFQEYINNRFVLSKVQVVVSKIVQEFETLENFNDYVSQQLKSKTQKQMREFLLNKDQGQSNVIMKVTLMQFLTKCQICPFIITKSFLNHVASIIGKQPQISFTWEECLNILGVLGVMMVKGKDLKKNEIQDRVKAIVIMIQKSIF